MPDPQQKLVKVPDVGVVAFPQDMHDDHIAAAIKKHQERLSPTPSIGNDGKLSSSPPASSPTLAQTDNTYSPKPPVQPPQKPLPLAEIKAQAAKLNPKVLAPQKSQPLPAQPKEALNKYPNPEDRPPKESFEFNKAWSKPGPYAAKLAPQEEIEFRKWAAANPQSIRGEVGPAPNYDPLPMADYDVRAHFQAAKRGDPAATLVPNKWDGKIHGNDKFKTPYNGGFSNESMYALPNAPRWVGDKLMTADGKLVTDETPRKPGGVK
jgi:hypothetical protein